MSHDRTKRLAHVITTIERGGAENALSVLVSGQVERGHDVTVVPLKGNLELFQSLQEMGVKVDLSLHKVNFALQLFKGLRTLRGFDFVHAHLPRSEILVSITRWGLPFFVTRHNAERFYPAAPRILSSMLSRLISHKAQAVIAISNTVKHFLQQEGDVNPSKRILVIHYGYSLKNTSDITGKNRFNKSLNIGTISRLEEQKNLPFMFSVIAELASLEIDVRLEIVGVGSKISELRDLASRLNLEDRVLFLGKSSDVLEFIGDKDLFLMTSNYEGFGMSLLEAMDANVPIVAPKHSAFPEVLGFSHGGLYEPNNIDDCVRRIIELNSDAELRRNIVLEQRTRLSFFSVEKYVAIHDELYGSIN